MLRRPALLVLALAASSLAWGETLEPPERIARLSYVDGPVAFQGADGSSPSALPDRPLMPGDRLTTGRGGRAELALGTADIRLDEQAELSIVDLDAATVRIELDAGTASVHLHELLEDETFEIVTPNTTVVFHQPGEYRVEVPANDSTALTVRAGIAEVATAEGPVRVADGQHVRLAGRDALASLAAPPAADAFDDWVLEREVQLADAEPPRDARRDDAEYEELDDYGEWYDEPSYGRVWMPSYAYGGWDPFRHGRWERIGYHSWSWFEPVPWGAFTFHRGRWAYLDHLRRWCWVLGRRDHRRHFAHDTRPFGRPRDDARPRGDRSDRPRDTGSRRDDDRRSPDTRVERGPLRLGADRPPLYRRDVASAKQPSRRGTIVPSSNGNQNPPRRSAPAPQSGGRTVRSSPPAESPRPAPARTAPTTNHKFGPPKQIP